MSGLALLLGFVGALIGGVGAQAVAGRYAHEATAQRERAGQREEWGRRVERALNLTVSDSDRAQVAGFTMLEQLLVDELATDIERHQLRAVAAAIVGAEVARADRLDRGLESADTEE